MEADNGVMWGHTKERQQLEEAGNRFCPRISEGVRPCRCLDFSVQLIF
jgi:hypothetical protein